MTFNQRVIPSVSLTACLLSWYVLAQGSPRSPKLINFQKSFKQPFLFYPPPPPPILDLRWCVTCFRGWWSSWSGTTPWWWQAGTPHLLPLTLTGMKTDLPSCDWIVLPHVIAYSCEILGTYWLLYLWVKHLFMVNYSLNNEKKLQHQFCIQGNHFLKIYVLWRTRASLTTNKLENYPMDA